MEKRCRQCGKAIDNKDKTAKCEQCSGLICSDCQTVHHFKVKFKNKSKSIDSCHECVINVFRADRTTEDIYNWPKPFK